MQSPSTFPLSSDESCKKSTRRPSFLPASEWMNAAVCHTSGEKIRPKIWAWAAVLLFALWADVTRVAYLCYPAATVASDARINCKGAAKRGASSVFAPVRRERPKKWFCLAQRAVLFYTARLGRRVGLARIRPTRGVWVRISTHSAALSASVLCWKSIFQAPSEAARASESPAVLDVPCASARSSLASASAKQSDCEYCYWTGEPFTFGDTPCWRISFESIHAAAAPFWSAAEIDHNKSLSMFLC